MKRENLKALCKLLATCIKGYEITKMLTSFPFTESCSDYSTKTERLIHFLNPYDKSKLIYIIEYIMNPQRFINTPDVFFQTQEGLNSYLRFEGLELTSTGYVHPCLPAQSLNEAISQKSRLQQAFEIFNLHPSLLPHCQIKITDNNYFYTIFESTKSLLDKLRSISHASEDGVHLINKCFDGKSPLIVINQLQTQDDWSKHKALHNLLNFIIYQYRNSCAHQLKNNSTLTYPLALEALLFISRAMYELDNARLINKK